MMERVASRVGLSKLSSLSDAIDATVMPSHARESKVALRETWVRDVAAVAGTRDRK